MATSTFTLDNIRICCTVNGTKVDADFDYFPTEEELRNVISFLLKDESPSNLPSLIDCTVIRPNLTSLEGHACTSRGCELCHPIDDLAIPEEEDEAEEPCDHARVKCGQYYGGPCERKPAVNMNHRHIEEQEPRPTKEQRKKHKVCQSFHDTEWDLMNEEI
jgi:hypothetical protein